MIFKCLQVVANTCTYRGFFIDLIKKLLNRKDYVIFQTLCDYLLFKISVIYINNVMHSSVTVLNDDMVKLIYGKFKTHYSFNSNN